MRKRGKWIKIREPFPLNPQIFLIFSASTTGFASEIESWAAGGNQKCICACLCTDGCAEHILTSTSESGRTLTLPAHREPVRNLLSLQRTWFTCDGCFIFLCWDMTLGSTEGTVRSTVSVMKYPFMSLQTSETQLLIVSMDDAARQAWSCCN